MYTPQVHNITVYIYLMVGQGAGDTMRDAIWCECQDTP